jgi:tetraacyldisaccharide 4'-kinase
VIDGNYGFGNGRMIPLGALREPIIEAFKRIDAVILIGDDKRSITSQIPSNIPIFKAFIEADTKHIKPDTNYVAICGIGLPHKFLETLKTLNISVIGHEFFADHYPYTIMDINRLLSHAHKNHARIITTSKDFINIKSITSNLSLIDVLPITVKCDNEEILIQFLKDRIVKSS